MAKAKKKKEEPAPSWPDDKELQVLNLRQLKEMVLSLRKEIAAAQGEVTEAATDRVRVYILLFDHGLLVMRADPPLSPALPFCRTRSSASTTSARASCARWSCS